MNKCNIETTVKQTLKLIAKPKCTETDLKKSHTFPIWVHSDPICMGNLPILALTYIDLTMSVQEDRHISRHLVKTRHPGLDEPRPLTHAHQLHLALEHLDVVVKRLAEEIFMETLAELLD